jgi:hypothetical protein
MILFILVYRRSDRQQLEPTFLLAIGPVSDGHEWDNDKIRPLCLFTSIKKVTREIVWMVCQDSDG